MHVKRWTSPRGPAMPAAAMLAALLGAAMPAQADDPPVAPPGGETLKMNQHFTGSVGQTGDFAGRLVCLRSRESFTPLSASECAAGDRVYALEMKGEKSLRPLQAASPEVESQLRAMLGREVRVMGRFHNETNTVIVASVRPADGAS